MAGWFRKRKPSPRRRVRALPETPQPVTRAELEAAEAAARVRLLAVEAAPRNRTSGAEWDSAMRAVAGAAADLVAFDDAQESKE